MILAFSMRDARGWAKAWVKLGGDPSHLIRVVTLRKNGYIVSSDFQACQLLPKKAKKAVVDNQEGA